MKKMMKIIIIIVCVIILVILIFPRKFYINDGGSYGYSAVLYEITFHRGDGPSSAESYGSTTVYIFPFFEFNLPPK